MRRHAWADDEGRGGQEACGTCVEHRGADHFFQLHNRGVFAPKRRPGRHSETGSSVLPLGARGEFGMI